MPEIERVLRLPPQDRAEDGPGTGDKLVRVARVFVSTSSSSTRRWASSNSRLQPVLLRLQARRVTFGRLLVRLVLRRLVAALVEVLLASRRAAR